MFEKSRFVIIFLVLAAIFSWVFFIRQDSNKDNSVVLGYTETSGSLPLFIAQEKGFFADKSVKVELKKFQDGQKINDAILAKKIAGGGLTAIDIIFAAQSEIGGDTAKIIAMKIENENQPILELISGNSTNITSIEGLEGKTIGYFPATPAVKLWSQEILKSHRVDIDKVHMVPSSASVLLPALKSGQFDAISTISPLSTAAKTQRIGRSLNEDQGLIAKSIGINPFPQSAIILSADFQNNQKVDANKIISAIDKAIDFIRKNPEDAKEVLERYLSEQQRSLIPHIRIDNYWKSSEIQADKLEAYLNFLLGKGILDRKFELDKIIIKQRIVPPLD